MCTLYAIYLIIHYWWLWSIPVGLAIIYGMIYGIKG